MWKNVKALVEPLERLMTTLGTKGPKSNTTHSGGHSRFTKQQVSEIQKQKQITVNNFSNTSSKALEQTSLRNFLFENFSLFKIFSPQPVPIPVVFSQTPLRVCKPQGFGLISQHTFLHPAGTRNIVGRSGVRRFSTIQPAMLNNSTNSGGVVLAQLGFRPFSAFAKSGSLWFQREDLDNNKFTGIKKQKIDRKKEILGRKIFAQSNNKGIFEIVKNSDIVEGNKNKPRIVRRSGIKKSSEENKAVENVPDVLDVSVNDNENVQVYMSIILSSSIFWNLDDNSTSSSSSASSVNSTASVLSYLLQRTVPQRHNSQLNSSFVQHLQEIAEMQHDHMMEVISILGALLRHGDFEVKISGCELRVNFPRGMQKIEVENMLQSLGIDPNSSHFELEELIFDKSIEFSPPTGEGDDMQLPEPNIYYFDDELTESSTSPGYEILSYSSSSDSSPVLLPSRGSMEYISGISSACNSPPRLGTEYITGIQEFLNAVDEALVRNANMFSSRDDNDEIGEDYYEN